MFVRVRLIAPCRVFIAAFAALLFMSSPSAADLGEASTSSFYSVAVPVVVSGIASAIASHELGEFSQEDFDESVEALAQSVDSSLAASQGAGTASAVVAGGISGVIAGIYDISTSGSEDLAVVHVRFTTPASATRPAEDVILEIVLPRAQIQDFGAKTGDPLDTHTIVHRKDRRVLGFVVGHKDRAFFRLVTKAGRILMVPARTISPVSRLDFRTKVFVRSHDRYHRECRRPEKASKNERRGFIDPRTLTQQGQLAADVVVALEDLYQTRKTSKAVVGRSGTFREKHPMEYIHAGLFTRGANGEWSVQELLECAAVSQVQQRGAWDFFVARASFLRAVIAPINDAALRNNEIFSDSMYRAMHNPNYNIISNPHNVDYQNSNEWILDLLAFARSEKMTGGLTCSSARLARSHVTVKRSQAKVQLRRDDYLGELVALGSGEKLFAAVSTRGTLDDHVNCDGSLRTINRNGRRIVTVKSLIEYMQRTQITSPELIRTFAR